MGVSIVAIIVALIAIVIVWRLLTGAIKLGAIVVIVLGALYVLSRGIG
jgi:hypothetical protein